MKLFKVKIPFVGTYLFLSLSLFGQIPNGPALTIDNVTSPSSGSQFGGALDPAPGTPSASHLVQLKLGSVDAVTGQMNLSLALGPKLPGRIPFGFSWSFDSGSSPRRAVSINGNEFLKMGGVFDPILWPSTSGASPTITAWINGTPLTFFKASNPDPTRMPSASTLVSWLKLRGMPDPGSTAPSGIYPSSDGAKFLIVFNARTSAILQGDTAIWTNDLGIHTYVTNLWGDKVSITKTLLTNAASGIPYYYVPTKIRIQNDNYPTNHWIEMAIPVTEATSVADTVTITITNGMHLPATTMVGNIRSNADTCYLSAGIDPTTQTEKFQEYLTGFWSAYFLPSSIKTVTDDQTDSRITTFQWTIRNYSTGSSSPQTVVSYQDYPLISITHSDGLKEAFSYHGRYIGASRCYNPFTGKYWGYHNSGASSWNPYSSTYFGLRGPEIQFDDPSSKQDGGVWSIQFTGPGVDRSVYLPSTFPVLVPVNPADPSSAYVYTHTDHNTVILYYPTSTPGASTPYRGVRLTHPSGQLWQNPMDPQALLTCTSAILKAEEIHGAGIPTSMGSLTGTYDLPWGWSIPAVVVDRTTTYESWDVRSWANPTGSLLYPVNPVAAKVTSVEPSLPTTTRIESAWDAWGPTQADEYKSGPTAAPAVTGTTVGAWVIPGTAPTPPSAPIQRTGNILRAWDGSVGLMQSLTDQKQLLGYGLSALRSGTGGAVNFGVTANTYETGSGSLGRITHVTGTRGAFVSDESRVYVPGKPMVQETTKTLTRNGVAVLANPTNLNAPASVGKLFAYDNTPFQWLQSETDKVTGRTTTYNLRDDLGRVTRLTDPDGNVTTVDYDGWGRVWHLTRLARGGVGSVVTTYSYASDDSWASRTVQADGLPAQTTTAHFDAYGRVRSVQNPDGSNQTVDYDGFGQKVRQSPVLAAGMSHFGDYQWTYDGQGRLTQTLDPQNRVLTTVVQQPAWTTISADGQSFTGVVTTVQDDRGFTRSTVADLLGQKVAVVDQKGQASTFNYDKDGHLVRTQQGSQIRRYAYDDNGWLLSRSEPEEGTTIYEGFNQLGSPSVTTLTGLSGQGSLKTSVVWDQHLRPVTVTASAGGSPSLVRTIHYRDDFFVPTDFTEKQPYGTLTETYGYDAIGRLNSKTVSDGAQQFTVSRTLDPLGNPISLTYPSGGGRPAQVLAFGYDAALRSNNLALDGLQRAHMDYPLASGATVQTVLTLGTGGGTNPITTTSTFTNGELAQVTHANATLTENNAITWTAGGLMLSRGTDTFGYDALQRLIHARTTNIDGSMLTQDFDYDRYGNRTTSRATVSAGVLPDEVLNWAAVYNGANELPATVSSLDYTTGAPTGNTLATGVQYDNYGRITQVWAIPGNSASVTGWDYDASGRVVLENSTAFLLDSGGLRFKRMRPDGSIQYTVYGFAGDPLSVFEQPAPVTTKTLAARTLTSSPTTKTASLLAPPIDNGPLAGGIGIPRLNPNVWVGMPLSFSAAVTGATLKTTYYWDFGDGQFSTVKNPSHTFAVAKDYTVTLTASDPTAGSISDTLVVHVLNKPAIASFLATPSVIYPNPTSNQPLPWSSTLSWSVNNATSLSLDQGIGTVTGTTSRIVTPTVSTTYTLSATNAGGTVTGQVAVAVNAAPPPVISSFTCNQSTVMPGQSVTLSCSVSNYNTLSLAGIGPLSGTSITLNPTQTTTYTLVATNGSGSVSQDLTVTVLQIPGIEAFYATPTTVQSGQAVQLTWGVTNYSTLALAALPEGASANVPVSIVPQSGGVAVSPTQTTSYILTASNTVGSSMKVVKVTVVSSAAGALAWKKSMVYGFGQLISEETATGTTYLQSDQVGSPNILVDGLSRVVVGRSKNLPFGERYGQSGQKSFRRFTNHEDQDGSPIYMQARTYLPAYGKFAQVDPAYDQTKDDPESWNLYNYVTNNPVTHTDPDGRETAPADTAGTPRETPTSKDPPTTSPRPEQKPNPAPEKGKDGADKVAPAQTDGASRGSKTNPVDGGGATVEVTAGAPAPLVLASKWIPVPGAKDWDKRRDHFPETHDHYRKKGRERARKVFPDGRQIKHGSGLDEDVPQDVIDKGTKNKMSSPAWPWQEGWDFHQTPAGWIWDHLLTPPSNQTPQFAPVPPPMVPRPVVIPLIP